MVFTRPEAVERLASGEMQRPSQIMLLILPWRHDLRLRAWRHPRCPNLGQEVDSECVHKDHHCMRWQVFGLKSNAGQPLNSVRVIIVGDQLGPLPDPASLMEPATHGFR